MRNFDNIKVLAAAKKITMSDVATAAGITYQQLNRIVRKQSTTIDTLEKIAAALDVPVSYFLDVPESESITIGDNSPGSGKNNTVNADMSEALLRAFDEIAAQRRLTEKAQVQIDELLLILKTKLSK